MSDFAQAIRQGIPASLPSTPAEEDGINHAPRRPDVLSRAEKVLAIQNALR